MSTIVIHSPDVRYEYHLIIPHPVEMKVLFVREEGGWSLPYFIPNEIHFGVVGHINQMAEKLLGIKTATRRCIDIAYNSQVKMGTRAYILDNLSPDWTPGPNTIWLAVEELPQVTMAIPTQALIVQKWANWEKENSSLRVPWSQPGWFQEVEAWVLDLVDRLDMKPTAPVRQIRAWSRSSTVQADTDGGTLYFKAVPEMFSYEPVITRVLAQRYPQNIPFVLAVDGTRSWLLMRGFAGKRLSEVDDLHVWEQAMREYARIQVDFVDRTQNLVALGFPDRHVDQLSSQIDHLLMELPDALSADEQSRLYEIAPELRNMCYDLMDYNIPLSISHGDLWSGNMILTDEGNILIYDWSDSSVTHPFFDLPFFLTEINPELMVITNSRERLRDAYLEAWYAYEPMENLQKAYDIARKLAFLHQALVYHRVILPSIEAQAKWEMAKMLPYLLRQLLEVTAEIVPES